MPGSTLRSVDGIPASALSLTPAGLWRRVRKALVLLGRTRYRRGLRHGVAAAIEHRHLATVPARTVIDVGAHRGQFSLLALELFPDARIYAFEPLEGPRRRFAAALGDDPRLRLFPLALGAAPSTRSMQIAARDDCSSLRPATAAQTGLVPTARAVASEPVQVARLADVLGRDELTRPALLKIDVQGYEREVLDGAADLLSAIDVVCIEASFRELYAGQALVDELIGRLSRAGFTLHAVYNRIDDHHGVPSLADLDFRRDSHAAADLGHHRQPR